MKLQDALKNIVRHHGIDVLCEARIVNILSDNNAFENRATKMVLRNMLELGYLTKVIELDDVCEEQKTLQLMTICQNVVNDGFQERIVQDIINSISYALGWTNTNLSQVEDAIPSTDILQTLSSVFDRKIEPDYDLDEFGVAYSCDGKRLLFGNDNVTDYGVREGVLVICDNAFEDAKELKSITIPNTLLVIGDSAFSGCEKLESLSLPNSVLKIGTEAFSCTNLQKIVIPRNVIQIGGAAFWNCHIEDFVNKSPCFVTHNGILYSRDKKRLISTFNYLELLEIPEGVQIISYRAFRCTLDSFVEFPSTLKIIEDGAFELSSIESIKLPEGVIQLGKSTFGRCDSLVSVDLPDSIETIDDYCFELCYNLKEVNLPKSLRKLGLGALHGYTLKEIELQKNLSVIVGNPFYGSRVERLILNSPNFKFENGLLYSADYKRLIAYLGDERDVFINDNVIEIGDYVFYGKRVCHIHFPKCLKSIGKHSFYECKKLLECDLSQTNLETIGKNAFENCINITSVSMPDFNSCIEDSVFTGCKKLSHVTLSSQIKTIGEFAFWGCSNLEYVTSLKHVVYIGRFAFLDCKKLKNIELSCIESLGSGALNSQIRKITIPIGSKDRIESVLTKSYHQKHLKYLEESDLL